MLTAEGSEQPILGALGGCRCPCGMGLGAKAAKDRSAVHTEVPLQFAGEGLRAVRPQHDALAHTPAEHRRVSASVRIHNEAVAPRARASNSAMAMSMALAEKFFQNCAAETRRPPPRHEASVASDAIRNESGRLGARTDDGSYVGERRFTRR